MNQNWVYRRRNLPSSADNVDVFDSLFVLYIPNMKRLKSKRGKQFLPTTDLEKEVLPRPFQKKNTYLCWSTITSLKPSAVLKDM